MAVCKCGLSNSYPECDGMHSALKHEKLREAMRKAFEDNKHLLAEDSVIESPWEQYVVMDISSNRYMWHILSRQKDYLGLANPMC